MRVQALRDRGHVRDSSGQPPNVLYRILAAGIRLDPENNTRDNWGGKASIQADGDGCNNAQPPIQLCATSRTVSGASPTSTIARSTDSDDINPHSGAKLRKRFLFRNRSR